MHIFSSIIGLAANVISQVCISRYIPRFGLLKSILVGFIFGMCILLFLSLSGNISSLLVNGITYSALGYGYFHFINLGETARRIRILRELYDSKEGLSMAEILERYNAKEVVEKRINRLINSGQIIYRNGRYYIGKPTMLLIARIIATMKLIVLGKER